MHLARITYSSGGRRGRKGRDIAYHLFTVDLVIYRPAVRSELSRVRDVIWARFSGTMHRDSPTEAARFTAPRYNKRNAFGPHRELNGPNSALLLPATHFRVVRQIEQIAVVSELSAAWPLRPRWVVCSGRGLRVHGAADWQLIEGSVSFVKSSTHWALIISSTSFITFLQSEFMMIYLQRPGGSVPRTRDFSGAIGSSRHFLPSKSFFSWPKLVWPLVGNLQQ